MHRNQIDARRLHLPAATLPPGHQSHSTVYLAVPAVRWANNRQLRQKSSQKCSIFIHRGWIDPIHRSIGHKGPVARCPFLPFSHRLKEQALVAGEAVSFSHECRSRLSLRSGLDHLAIAPIALFVWESEHRHCDVSRTVIANSRKLISAPSGAARGMKYP